MKAKLLAPAWVLLVFIASASGAEPLYDSVAYHHIWNDTHIIDVPGKLEQVTVPSDEVLLHVTLLITNRSNSIMRVPTKPTGSGYKTRPSGVTIRLSAQFPLMSKNMKVIVSQSQLNVVELKTGETAMIEWEGYMKPEFTKDVDVSFIIDKSVADRYQLFPGVASVKSEDDAERLLPPRERAPRK